MKARLAVIAAGLTAALLSACGDPTALKASLLNSVDTLSVFALSGTPPNYPSGVAFLSRQPVHVDGFALFDVAFDINADGDAVIYPVKLVVASGSARPVNLQRIAQPFDLVTEAPKTGYEGDSALVAPIGQTIVVQSAHNAAADLCQFAINPNIYAKISVDSVNLASRSIYFRMGLDSNCGFRSFAEGVPTF
ncbi:MAG TPA: hypothetical protein VFP26_15530 [Gemmatimonadaceae bacterium]|jgi:hypothetical protein|nr:hypothetical protein [Gemmatimonadaceae bacterium]